MARRPGCLSFAARAGPPAGALGLGSLPESALRQVAAGCRRFLQVPLGLFKLKRRGFEAPLKRQKWFRDLLANTSSDPNPCSALAMGAIRAGIRIWSLTSMQNLVS